MWICGVGYSMLQLHPAFMCSAQVFYALCPTHRTHYLNKHISSCMFFLKNLINDFPNISFHVKDNWRLNIAVMPNN